MKNAMPILHIFKSNYIILRKTYGFNFTKIFPQVTDISVRIPLAGIKILLFGIQALVNVFTDFNNF